MNKLKNINITKLKGVGPKKAQLLKKINIETVFDLINYFPRSYEDMKNFAKLKDKIGDKGLFKLEVLSEPNIRRVKGNLEIMTVSVTDGNTTGEIVFFNQSFYKNYFHRGYKVNIYGSVSKKSFNLQILNPRIIKPNEIGSYEPIYNLTSGLTNNDIKKFITSAFKDFSSLIKEFVSINDLYKYYLIPIEKAYYNIHFPKNFIDIEQSKKRLAFNELLLLQFGLENNSYIEKNKVGINLNFENHKNEIFNFINNLPFKLTNAQNRVFKEIISDFNKNKTMNRLVQGDVGSGKTVIASLCLYLSYLNGYQSALMAPTEILAKQHYKTISEFFSNIDINIKLLTGDLTLKEKQNIYNLLESGEIDILIGTHALIQENVNFKNLALTIIDEQHRFGVNQRKTLYEKGNNPHNLSMTATPIPRTLALIIYGDMDISIIDELPPGRQSIDTFVVNESYLDRLDNFVIEQIKEGRQVYIVCPLIEENDMPLKSLEEAFSHYNSEKFKSNNIKTFLLHGKLKNDEKNEIMTKFLNNEGQILVSTTVIEVGINVPNANLMIIFNADRFGLSQLHQLRGRVGRGSEKSYCVLINNNESEISYKRMKIMKTSNDGFYISEKDLELRGEGELLGTRQHGIDLKMVNINSDIKLIELVKSNYETILENIKENKELYEELIYLNSLINNNF